MQHSAPIKVMHFPHRFRSPSSHALLAWLALAFLALSLCFTLALPAQAKSLVSNRSSSAAEVETPRVRAELVAQAPDGVNPGQSFLLGLQIEHQPEWHTYWKNSGDSGLATELSWQLPPGLMAGAIQWPTPQTLRVGPLVNYGYEDSLLLPVPINVAADFQAPASGMVDIKLHASWLVCRVECIPEEADLTLQIPVHGSTGHQGLAFEQARLHEPVALTQPGQAQVIHPATSANTSANAEQKLPDEKLQIRVQGLPKYLQGQTLDFYPEAIETFWHAAELGKDWQQSWDGDTWTAQLPLSDMRGETPAQLAIVLALPPAQRSAALQQTQPIGWRVELPVQGKWTAATLAGVSPALAAALEANKVSAPESTAPMASSSGSLWAALLGGFLGGLILNLMPCVFPVLAIKVLGFARHSQDRKAQRASGLAYTAGVVLSFLALGGLLLGLRAAGQQLGWGFQLQSPAVVALLAALFTLLGLNLAGLFEFGRMLPSSWASAQARNPVADSFLSGVLAVAIASPCTAPFMGASLGFAIDMPAAQALAVFAALGIGMALPYVLASFVPAVVRWLPRPGQWMETFRNAMAFPMFATVIWLVWVLGQQSGIDAAAALLLLLLALSALIWTLNLQGRTRWILSAMTVLLTAGIAYYAAPLITEPAPQSSAQAPAGERWQAWSSEKVQTLQTSGKPVFVDFTAAWCVTCQVNKRTTLNRADVLAAFDQHQVQLLRADWTRRDPAITTALQQLGRSGVPVYVLYAPGKTPVVLTELLTPAEVLETLVSL